MNKDNQSKDRADEIAAKCCEQIGLVPTFGYQSQTIAAALREYASIVWMDLVAERDRLAHDVEELREWKQGKKGIEDYYMIKERYHELVAKTERLNHAYSHYIDLLGSELNDVVPIAAIHGWASQRFMAGEKARDAIKEVLKETNL